MIKQLELLSNLDEESYQNSLTVWKIAESFSGVSLAMPARGNWLEEMPRFRIDWNSIREEKATAESLKKRGVKVVYPGSRPEWKQKSWRRKGAGKGKKEAGVVIDLSGCEADFVGNLFKSRNEERIKRC